MVRFSHGIDGLTLFQVGLLMGIITMGGCSLVTLSNETNATGKTNEIHLSVGSFCLDSEDIFPCVCSYDTRNNVADMDCSNVTGEVQLKTIFNKEFSYTRFRKLIIDNNKNIITLKEGDFGNASFTEIHINYGVLAEIEDLTFKASWGYLTSLHVQDNRLTSVPDIWNFTRLSDLNLVKNNLTEFPILRSETLKNLDLGYNNFKEIPFYATQTLPKLQTLSCTHNALTEIYSGTFSVHNDYLRYLDFSYNQLTTIPDDAIRLHGMNTVLKLWNNQITSLPYAVVVDVTDTLDVAHNELSELPWNTYSHLLERDVLIYLYDNPINCSCDIAWLIEDQSLLIKLPGVDHDDDLAPTCSDGVRFIDLDPDFYRAMCH